MASFSERHAIKASVAIDLLSNGNQRFREGRCQNVNFNRARLDTTLEKRKPFAVVLTCSDLNVPPEVMFDQPLGELFVIRVAGGAVDRKVLGAIEMAVGMQGARLVLVLGHEKCAAIAAALHPDPHPGSIGSIVEALAPAVQATKDFKYDRLERTIEKSVKLTIAQILKESPLVDSLKVQGDALVRGAVFEWSTRRVRFLDPDEVMPALNPVQRPRS